MTAVFAMTEPILASIEALMARATARALDPVAVGREALRVTRERVLPAGLARHRRTVERMARLAADPAAPIGEAARARLLGALAYVSEPDDLIPDSTPEIGLLDDLIVIDLVARELHAELAACAPERCEDDRAARRAMHCRMARRREQRARRGGLFALR